MACNYMSERLWIITILQRGGHSGKIPRSRHHDRAGEIQEEDKAVNDTKNEIELGHDMFIASSTLTPDAHVSPRILSAEG